MTNATPHSAQLSGEANVHYSLRFSKRPERVGERLLAGPSQGHPTGAASAPAMPTGIACSPVGTQPPRSGITGQVDDRHSPAAIIKGTTSPPPHEKAGSKHMGPELGREAPPARCHLAELPEGSSNLIGSGPAGPCVSPHGSLLTNIEHTPESDESQAKEKAQPPTSSSARRRPDCLLVSTPRDTSSIRAGTQGVGPQAVKGNNTAGATAALAQSITEPLAAPYPMEMRATYQKAGPSDRMAGCLSGALGAWMWGWHAGSQPSLPTDATPPWTSLVAAATYLEDGGSSPDNKMTRKHRYTEDNDTTYVTDAPEPKGPFPLRPAGALKTPSHDRSTPRSKVLPALPVPMSSEPSSSGTPSKTGNGKSKIDWSNLPDTPAPKRFASLASQKDQQKPPTSCAVQVHPIANKYGSFTTTFCQLDPRDLYTRFKDEWNGETFVAPSEANSLLFSLGYRLNARGYYVGLQKIVRDDPVDFIGIKYPSLNATHSASILRDVVQSVAKVRNAFPPHCDTASHALAAGAQYSDIQKDVYVDSQVEWSAPKEATISITDSVLLRTDVLVMKDDAGLSLTNEQIDALFPLQRPSLLVSPPGTLFKDGLRTKFPGGKFSQIRRGPDRLLWGVLYLQPSFEPDEMMEYFQNFGIDVVPARLKIVRD